MSNIVFRVIVVASVSSHPPIMLSNRNSVIVGTGHMDRETIRTELLRQIIEVLPSVNIDEIDNSDRLNDIGANSVDRMEIVTLTLDSLDLPIPLSQVATAQNVGEIIELLFQKASVCPRS